MTSVASAAHDPVFYLHHCFIDYIWEKFRERQRDICGEDPETDYIEASGKSVYTNGKIEIMLFFPISVLTILTGFLFFNS